MKVRFLPRYYVFSLCFHISKQIHISIWSAFESTIANCETYGAKLLTMLFLRIGIAIQSRTFLNLDTAYFPLSYTLQPSR